MVADLSTVLFAPTSDEPIARLVDELDTTWELTERAGYGAVHKDLRLKHGQLIVHVLYRSKISRFGIVPTLQITGEFTQYDRAVTDEYEANQETYRDLVETVVAATDPRYGCGGLHVCEEPKELLPMWELNQASVNRLYWLNVFGDAYVERFGRSALLEAPAWETRALASGHVMVVCSPDPTYADDGWVDSQKAVRQYLGL